MLLYIPKYNYSYFFSIDPNFSYSSYALSSPFLEINRMIFFYSSMAINYFVFAFLCINFILKNGNFIFLFAVSINSYEMNNYFF